MVKLLCSLILFLSCAPLSATISRAFDASAFVYQDTKPTPPWGQCKREEESIDPNLYHSQPWDQMDSGTCYAASSAALIYSYWREINPKARPPSAAYLAFQTQLQFRVPVVLNLTWGHTKPNKIGAWLQQGSLVETTTFFSLRRPLIPLEALIGPKERNEAVIINALQQLLPIFERQDPSTINIPEIIQNMNLLPNTSRDKLIELAKDLLVFLSKPDHWIKQPLTEKIFYQRTLLTFFRHRFASETISPKDLPSLRIKIMNTKAQYTSFLANELLHHPRPWIISVHSRTLSHSAKVSKIRTYFPSLHAVTAYGYRCRQGKIEFLIRNSWGGPAMRDLTLGKVKPTPKIYRGDFWIEASLLASYTAKGFLGSLISLTNPARKETQKEDSQMVLSNSQERHGANFYRIEGP